jgi:hypothetical protein
MAIISTLDLTDKYITTVLRYSEYEIYKDLNGKAIICELHRFIYRALLKYSENAGSLKATTACLICSDLLEGSHIKNEMMIGRTFAEVFSNLKHIFNKCNESEKELAIKAWLFIQENYDIILAEAREKNKKLKEKQKNYEENERKKLFNELEEKSKENEKLIENKIIFKFCSCCII